MKYVSLKLDASGWRHEWAMKNEESECRFISEMFAGQDLEKERGRNC